MANNRLCVDPISLKPVLTHFEKESGDNFDDIDESDLGESWVLELLQDAVINEWLGSGSEKAHENEKQSDHGVPLLCLRSIKAAMKRLLDEVIEACLCEEDDTCDTGQAKTKFSTPIATTLMAEMQRTKRLESDKVTVAANTNRLCRFLAVLEKSVLIPYCSVDGGLNRALSKLVELERCRGSWEESFPQASCTNDLDVSTSLSPASACNSRKQEDAQASSSVEEVIETSKKRQKIAGDKPAKQRSDIDSNLLARRLQVLLEQTELILGFMVSLGLVKVDIQSRVGYCHVKNRQTVATRTIWVADIHQCRAQYYALLGEFEPSITCLEEALAACKTTSKLLGNSKAQIDGKKTEVHRHMIVRLLQNTCNDNEHTVDRARKLLKSCNFTASICKNVFQFREERTPANSEETEFKQESIRALREQIVVLDNVFPIFKENGNSTDADDSASDLNFLKSHVFTEAFFAHHGYDSLLYDCLLTRCNPDYFSLFHDLETPRNTLDVVLRKFVERVKRFCAKNSDSSMGRLPDLSKARYAETWTHRRVHLGSHQLHVDSKNEGRTKHIENPVATFVLFLETIDADDGVEKGKLPHHSKISGPTLVTDQVRGSEATTVDSAICFFASPKTNRAVCFPGDLYHGVLPGKIASSSVLGRYRHTLMVSLWEELEETNIQHHLSPMENCPENGNQVFGPCRSICEEGAKHNGWMRPLLFSSSSSSPSREGGENHKHANVQSMDDEDLGVNHLKYAEPVFAGRVWELAKEGGRCAPGSYGVERCFQF